MSAGGVLALLRRNTIIVLILLLVVFVAGIELARPGTVNATWLSNALLFAAPLGILAAGQTLVMLTGGIDLSVAAVATGSAYILATNASLGSVAAVAARPRARHRASASSTASASRCSACSRWS